MDKSIFLNSRDGVGLEPGQGVLMRSQKFLFAYFRFIYSGFAHHILPYLKINKAFVAVLRRLFYPEALDLNLGTSVKALLPML